jgi:hypothetical protein
MNQGTIAQHRIDEAHTSRVQKTQQTRLQQKEQVPRLALNTPYFKYSLTLPSKASDKRKFAKLSFSA